MKKIIVLVCALCACVICGNNANANNVPPFFNEMDANKDGKISKAEAKDRIAENFDTLDKNKDGFLTVEEINADPNRQQRQGGAPAGGGFAEMDTNKDGKVSKAEAKDRILENFDTYDKNKDGFITQEEMAASRPQRQQ